MGDREEGPEGEVTITVDESDTPVSVVIPYSPEFTPRPLFEEARRSAISQTIRPTVITVTDAEGVGPGRVRNIGLERAETRYVAFLDADDLWSRDKLQRQLRLLDATGTGLCVQGPPMSEDDFLYRVLTGRLSYLTSSMMIDTEQVGARFEEELVRGEDTLFALESASQAGVCLCPDLCTVRQHEQSVTASGVDADDFRDQQLRFASLVRERVPKVHPYLQTLYTQLLTDIGCAYYAEGDQRSSIKYFLRALRQTPHPFTFAYLLRSVIAYYFRSYLV